MTSDWEGLLADAYHHSRVKPLHHTLTRRTRPLQALYTDSTPAHSLPWLGTLTRRSPLCGWLTADPELSVSELRRTTLSAPSFRSSTE